MRIQLDIEYIELGESIDYLSLPDEYIVPLYKCMEELPFWDKLKYFGKWGSKKLKKISSIEEIIKDSINWKNNPYILASNKEVMPRCGIIVNTYDHAMGLKITIGKEICLEFKERLITDLIGCVQKIHAQFYNVAVFGPRMSIMVHGIAYAQPRPPNNDRIWESTNLVNFASKEFHYTHRDGEKDQFDIICKAEVPEGVVKMMSNDLLIIKWIKDLTDIKLISERLSMHDSWFPSIIPLRRKAGYNKLGDELEAFQNLKSHSHLTFHDSFTKNGYKAVMINPDGTIDEETIEQMKDWVSNSRTPDGTFINELNLIAPNRESALLISDIVLPFGIKKVLYVDNDNHWWNPNPPGLWLS